MPSTPTAALVAAIAANRPFDVFEAGVSDELRYRAYTFAKDLDRTLLDCPEKALALRALHESVMLANVAIRIHGVLKA